MLQAVEWWRKASRNDVARDDHHLDLVSGIDVERRVVQVNLQLTAHKFVPEGELYFCLVSVEIGEKVIAHGDCPFVF